MTMSIAVQPPAPITSLSRGRKKGSSKYPFASLVPAVDGTGNFFEFEAKSRAGIYATGKALVPGAKFTIRRLVAKDGSNRVGPKGKQLWGCWRLK